MRRFVRLAVAVAALGGCASVQRSMGIVPPRSGVKIEESQFEQSVSVLGVQERQNDHPANSYFLRSWVSKRDGGVTHQLYVHDVYRGDWKNWDRANADDATSLKVVPITQTVGTCGASMGCELNESFGADVPESMLRAHSGGLTVKAYARSGATMIIAVSAQQIAAQLAATDSVSARYRAR